MYSMCIPFIKTSTMNYLRRNIEYRIHNLLWGAHQDLKYDTYKGHNTCKANVGKLDCTRMHSRCMPIVQHTPQPAAIV